MSPRLANKYDLPALWELMKASGSKFAIAPERINKRDISLIIRDPETGEAAAFLWIGLMSKNKLGYIDLFTVAPKYSRQGLGNKLARAAYKELRRRGTENVFGTIAKDEWHDRSAMNALKMAFMAKKVPYTFVECNLDNTARELGLKE